MRATAAPAAEQAGVTAWERQLPLGPGGTVTVQVAAGDRDQRVLVITNRPGRLLLHWGVEGGRGYKGGWRLPGEGSRPAGTQNYKNRALQTPFLPLDGGSGLQVRRCWLRWARAWGAAASADGGKPVSHSAAGRRRRPRAVCSRRLSCTCLVTRRLTRSTLW